MLPLWFIATIQGAITMLSISIDDIAMLGGMFAKADSRAERFKIGIGYPLGVFTVIIGSYILGNALALWVNRFSWVGGIFLVAIGIKTWPKAINTKKNINTSSSVIFFLRRMGKFKWLRCIIIRALRFVSRHTSFIYAYLGHILGATDNIIANCAIIMGKPHEFQMGYFTGSLLAALVLMSLVFVVARWEGLMTKIEKIRAIIIIIVGIKILIQGLRQYIGPVLRFFTPLMP